jgi:hypothetical protein
MYLPRYIGLAAQDGFVNEVEMLMQEMEAAGLPPGPRTFHGLVFSHLEVTGLAPLPIPPRLPYYCQEHFTPLFKH